MSSLLLRWCQTEMRVKLCDTHDILRQDNRPIERRYSKPALCGQLVRILRLCRVMSVAHKFRCLVGKYVAVLIKILYSFIWQDIADLLKRCWLYIFLQNLKSVCSTLFTPGVEQKRGLSSRLSNCILYVQELSTRKHLGIPVVCVFHCRYFISLHIHETIYY